MTGAYTVVSSPKMGDGTTLVNIVQRIGGALGAITVVVVLKNTGDSYQRACAGLPVLVLLNVLFALCMLSQGKHDEPEPQRSLSAAGLD